MCVSCARQATGQEACAPRSPYRRLCAPSPLHCSGAYLQATNVVQAVIKLIRQLVLDPNVLIVIITVCAYARLHNVP